jgi:hypothetical protein
LGGGNNNNEPKRRQIRRLGHRCVFLLNFSCFSFYFSCFFSIVDLPALNHVFWLPAMCLNTPSTHFDTHHIQTTHFGPHRPNEGHQRPTMANDGQHRPNEDQRGPTDTGIEERVGNEPERRQTRCLGPRCVFFFFLRVFLTYLPYFAHLSAPIYVFQPLAMLSSPNYMFQPPAMRSNLSAARFDLFQHPQAQMTCLALFGPLVCFLFFFLRVFFTYLLYHTHLPAPSYVFRPTATLPTPNYAFQPPATHFDHQAMSFHPQPCVSSSQLPVSTPTGPNDARHVVWALGAFFFSFFYMYFLFICPIIAICQPPATCFNPQPCFLTIQTCLSTPSHIFSTPINLFQHPRSRNTHTSNCTQVFYIFFFLALKTRV